MAHSERMATIDAAWLHMDTPTNRMVITGVLELDGPVDPTELAELLRERLVHRYPRFRQCIAHGTLGEARWVDDEAFDLRAHLHRVGVPEPGGREGLQTLVSQLTSSPLDPARPPWQVHLVQMGERSALVARLHHAMADGISLARVLLSLADAPDAEDELPHPPPLRSRIGAWLRDPGGVGGRLLEAGREVLAHPDHLLEATGEQIVEAARLGGGSAAVARKLLSMPDDPPSVLKGPLGPTKTVAWHDGVPLQRVKDLAHRLDGTVNDVLLTVLAGALCRYLRHRQDPVEQLRTFVPVNLRPLDQPIPADLGNRFGLVFLELPVDHRPPRQRFAEVKSRMDALKRSPEPAVTHAILSAVGLSPTQVERIVIDVFGAKVSLVTTNVPGPRAPLSLAGRTVSRILFWVPQAGAVGLGVSLFSYAGQVVWGISADAGLVPDPEVLIDAFTRALEDLEAAA